MIVYTSRMGYKAADYLDVTLTGNARHVRQKSAGGHRGIGLAFAPSPDLLHPFVHRRKLGLLTPEDWPNYQASYIAEMRVSYVTNRRAWDAALAMREVTLVCFCVNPAECHRTVLAGIFGKLGAQVMGER